MSNSVKIDGSMNRKERFIEWLLYFKDKSAAQRPAIFACLMLFYAFVVRDVNVKIFLLLLALFFLLPWLNGLLNMLFFIRSRMAIETWEWEFSDDGICISIAGVPELHFIFKRTDVGAIRHRGNYISISTKNVPQSTFFMSIKKCSDEEKTFLAKYFVETIMTNKKEYINQECDASDIRRPKGLSQGNIFYELDKINAVKTLPPKSLVVYCLLVLVIPGLHNIYRGNRLRGYIQLVLIAASFGFAWPIIFFVVNY